MDSGLYAVGCCVAHEVFVVPCSGGSWAICRRLLSVLLVVFRFPEEGCLCMALAWLNSRWLSVTALSVFLVLFMYLVWLANVC